MRGKRALCSTVTPGALAGVIISLLRHSTTEEVARRQRRQGLIHLFGAVIISLLRQCHCSVHCSVHICYHRFRTAQSSVKKVRNAMIIPRVIISLLRHSATEEMACRWRRQG